MSNYYKPIILILLITITFFSYGKRYKPIKFGVNDKYNKYAIERSNKLSESRRLLQFKKVSVMLKNDLKTFSSNPYAISRIKNELASIYSYQLLDIEKAIEIDRKLLKSVIPLYDKSGMFSPKNNIANQRVLSDITYKKDFLTVSSADIKDKASKRLNKNIQLVKGKHSTNSNYTLGFLENHFQNVKNDITSTYDNSVDRLRIYSRLIRAEYEIFRLNKKHQFNTYKYLLSGEIQPNQIDLTEIDFLSLADYFTQVFNQTGNVQFAKYALQTVYRPYINLRKSSNRWQYNTLINTYISTLIDANYQKKNYEDMVYYISLNKSRMLLEERLILSHNQGTSTNISNNLQDIKLDKSGLPNKQEFLSKLVNINNYLDFYVNGRYSQVTINTSSTMDRATMPLTTRDFGVETSDNTVEVFQDSSVYVTYINHGKIANVKKISGKKLKNLKTQLNNSFTNISSATENINRAPILKTISKKFTLPKSLTISPDKWIARHPLNYHLGVRTIRSVNLFTASTQTEPLNKINLLGFFNPTLDLNGAEQEATAIQSVLPNARLFKREDAKLTQLKQSKNANIIHLSMHGAFNSKDPKFSELYFAGAKRGLTTNDPNALYAKDMGQYQMLQNRQLIFAAACETGKISADKVNENELMGILRPLTANRNKNIILSLWKVDDQATKDFVSWFYQDLSKTHIISDAFLFAQSQTRKKYPNPYYWSAFYLSQAN